jgi:hypothetical protein
MPKRRYEILLPLRHNDGRNVAAESFDRTRQELVAQFGAVSFFPHSLLGTWMYEGNRFEDELVRVVVDVDDTAESRQFFLVFKGILLERFEQLEIYIASYPIEVI